MRLPLLPLLVTLPLLAGCHASVDTDKSASVTVGDEVDHADKRATGTATANGLTIDTDSFKASLDIPGMTMGGKNFDISGMKLYPGSRVQGMKVESRDKDGSKHSVVTVQFTSPAAPDAILKYAATEATAHDWSVTRNGSTLNGIGDEGKTMAYSVAPAGSGSSGSIVLTETK